MTPPLNLVLLNTRKSDEISEIHRRWIARVAPLCIAYDLHLTLANFGIGDSPTEFAKKIAPSTSIGKGGQRFIELAKKGWVQITKKIMSNSNYHLDITGKKIKLGLDTEIGAVTSILSKLKRD